MSPGPETAALERGATVRALAARINTRVVRDGVSLETALSDSAQPPPRDASLLKALCYGSLRWHHRLQWQVGQLLTRPLRRVDPEVIALARVGLYQLQGLRIPDHAAVGETVAAAESLGKTRAKGLINAVLRRFLREAEELDRRMAGVEEAATSHPPWMLERLKADWPDAWRAIVEANNVPPPMWLRINARRCTREAYLGRLAAAGIGVASAKGPSMAVLLAEPRPKSTLPGFDDGEVSVQDAAAQQAAGLLDLAPGQRVLDACAAPGGKSAHILESCPQLGELVAVDRDADRLAVVAVEFERLGLVGTLLRGDATTPGEWWDGRAFDRILLDAPCSALGVVRRHPDIKVLRRDQDIAQVVAQQRTLLEALWPLLAPGGRLLYATCTTVREENQQQIQQFLETAAAVRSSVSEPRSSRQILPGEANMDGFYYAWVDKAE